MQIEMTKWQFETLGRILQDKWNLEFKYAITALNNSHINAARVHLDNLDRLSELIGSLDNADTKSPAAGSVDPDPEGVGQGRG